MQHVVRFNYILTIGIVLLLQPLQSHSSQPLPAHRTPASATVDPRFQSALNTFRELSPKAKKEQIREMKNRLRSWKKENHRSAKEATDDTVLLALLAVFLPPLAVFLKEEEINARFWISVLLTLLFWLPGIVYALLVVFEVI